MKNNLKQNKNKGVTLIALIITIIVLIILAGVAIAGITGENGIFNRAAQASDATKEAQVREKVGLAVMESIDKSSGKLDETAFEDVIKNFGGTILEKTDDTIKVEMDGYEITLDRITGKIKETIKVGEEKTPKGVPAEFDINFYQIDGNVPEEGVTYEELVLTVNVTNKEEIGDGEITIKVISPTGENITENGLVTGNGDKSFRVDQNGQYTVTVETTVESIMKKVEKKIKENSINVPEFSRKFGTIDIRFINGTENETTEGTKANEPVLGTNMTPVNLKSDNSGWEETTKEKWEYSYTDTAGASKWANAVVKDENGKITGYFVWIPRYAYKITYHDGSIDGSIIGFSDSRGMVRKDEGKERVYTGGGNRRDAGDNFIVHPSFTNDVNVGGWGSELKGIWVAKYETSQETSDDGVNWSHTDTEDAATGNILTTNGGNTSSTKVRVVSKPGVSSWRNIEIGKMYKNSEGYDSKLNSHMMKNSEWGACAYLSYSNYGIGPNKVIGKNNTGNSFYTGGSNDLGIIYGANSEQSTTGNAYGAYDMNGGAYERVASYINNGNSNITKYGSIFATNEKEKAKSNNKVTVYRTNNSETDESSDDQIESYKMSGDEMFGDATYETTITHASSSGGWQSSWGWYPSEAKTFFLRGGDWDMGGSGPFYVIGDYGNVFSFNSFRLTLAF